MLLNQEKIRSSSFQNLRFSKLAKHWVGLLGVYRRRLISVTLILSALLISGCSSLQVAYSLAEGTLQERAKSYLNLSPEQQVRLEGQAGDLIRWHRKTLLPKYAAFLIAQANIANAGGWSRQQMSGAIQEIRSLMDETIEGASHFIAAVLIDQTTLNKTSYIKARMTENLIKRRLFVRKNNFFQTSALFLVINMKIHLFRSPALTSVLRK